MNVRRHAGKRITSLGRLRDLAFAKRAVICPASPIFAGKPRPAAFMLNLSGGTLLRLMEKGLFLYATPSTAKKETE